MKRSSYPSFENVPEHPPRIDLDAHFGVGKCLASERFHGRERVRHSASGRAFAAQDAVADRQTGAAVGRMRCETDIGRAKRCGGQVDERECVREQEKE
eukprot:3930934-Rhodomonas_salina.1